MESHHNKPERTTDGGCGSYSGAANACIYPKIIVRIVKAASKKPERLIFKTTTLVSFCCFLVLSCQCWYNRRTDYWSEMLFLINNVFHSRAATLRSPFHSVRNSVLRWRSGVMKDNADNWSFVWRTSSPKYHSGKVSSQLLMLRHPPLGDLVFSSRDVLSVFTKPSASRKASITWFRCSIFSFSCTSLIYLSTAFTGWLSRDTVEWKFVTVRCTNHQITLLEILCFLLHFDHTCHMHR